MPTDKENIETILAYEDREEMLRKLLYGLRTVNNGTLISHLRQQLNPLWTDGLWWPSDKLVNIIPYLFTKKYEGIERTYQAEWETTYNTYRANVYVCNLCAKEMEVNVQSVDHGGLNNYTHPHMYKECSVMRELIKQSDSLNGLKNRLSKYMNRSPVEGIARNHGYK
jgi:hypothetical protein